MSEPKDGPAPPGSRPAARMLPRARATPTPIRPNRPKVRQMPIWAPGIRPEKARSAEQLGTIGWGPVLQAARFSIGSPLRLPIVRYRLLPTQKSQTSTPAVLWSSRSTTGVPIGGVSLSIFRPVPPKRSVSFAAASRPSASNPLRVGERRTGGLLQPPRHMLRAPIRRQSRTINQLGSIRGSSGPHRRTRPAQAPRSASRVPIPERSPTINRPGLIRGSSSGEARPMARPSEGTTARARPTPLGCGRNTRCPGAAGSNPSCSAIPWCGRTFPRRSARGTRGCVAGR